ncbi:MAG: glutathione S-transferase family protein [Hyphomicrobiales bacterium]|nr:glutathione S-transferase family protein [Hyphomicrobiales bacterium]
MYVLVMGSKNYSSWSVRAWLALKMVGAEFTEIVIRLDKSDTAELVAAHSPSGLVPVLKDGALAVWDSLAIIEYLNERHPQAGLWPADAAARARARSICAEMHSGFAALRRECPMNLRRTPKPIAMSDEVKASVAHIEQMWSDCRAGEGAAGPFLFGRLSAADAVYAPVVSRFHVYKVPVTAESRAYMNAVMALPEWNELTEAARAEPPISKYDEIGAG